MRSLKRAEKASLREAEVFDWIDKHDLICVYEAIHVQGFADAFGAIEAAESTLRAGLTSGVSRASTWVAASESPR